MIEIVHQHEPTAGQPPRPANAEQAQARLVQGNEELAQFWNQSFDRERSYREVIPFDPGMSAMASIEGV